MVLTMFNDPMTSVDLKFQVRHTKIKRVPPLPKIDIHVNVVCSQGVDGRQDGIGNDNTLQADMNRG